MKQIAKLKQSWIWPEAVRKLAIAKREGYTLNICAGASGFGDVQVDLDPADAAVLKMDMRDLEFPDEAFDTVVIDPPWKLGYYQRFKPFYEAVRVCKIGGKIIYNATWIPHANNTEIEEVWVRRDSHWGNVSVITIFRKTGPTPAVKE